MQLTHTLWYSTNLVLHTQISEIFEISEICAATLYGSSTSALALTLGPHRV